MFYSIPTIFMTYQQVHFYTYVHTVLFQTVQFTQSKCQKTVLFQTVQFSISTQFKYQKTVLIQTVQFSISTVVCLYSRLRIPLGKVWIPLSPSRYWSNITTFLRQKPRTVDMTLNGIAFDRNTVNHLILRIVTWSYNCFVIIIIIYSFRVFHISVSWWFFTGVWVTARLLKSPWLVSGIWLFSAMLSFG